MSRPGSTKTRVRHTDTDGADDPVLAEYSRLARNYDARWAFYIAATTRETLARTAVARGERVLDVGCGTGILLSQLARRFPSAELAGVDPVPEMLAIARRRLGPWVPLTVGWAEELPFPDGSFDVLVSSSALHYFHAPVIAFVEMARVLRPGGRVVITDWRRDYWASPIIRTSLNLRRRHCGRIFRPGELRTLFEDVGFVDIQVARYRINRFWGVMTGVGMKPER